ncbi:putative 26S proteasome non-ATPase regulatory subunit 8 [Smittium culicis]|uniref:Putative 26S proteasome non-ATPase regulatory subunit 8 n=1 Tax=Smittium culicis TaxID=133412 RepID=A0A1R1YGC1_9FUNG|nr:putative 26S proteasome non-ATPase regulatory subunit 8 [Smittium culicis]
MEYLRASEASQIYSSTVQLVQNNSDIAQIDSNLLKLKRFLVLNSFLDPSNIPDTNTLTLCREILELGAEYTIAAGNMDAFEDYINKLSAFYFSPNETVSAESPKKHYFMGLHLMQLLTQSRITDFHLALEQLDTDDIRNNAYLLQPIEFEQAMTEGNYKKIIKALHALDPNSIAYKLVATLSLTIRKEIASFASSLYASLPVNDAKALLFCASVDELLALAAEFGWSVSADADGSGNGNGGRIVFNGSSSDDALDFDPTLVIEQNLVFARELERIV